MIAVDPATVQAGSAVVIAVLTAALVGVTVAYVVQTARLAKYAKVSADSAERSLLLESMPVVLPETGGSSRGGGRVSIQVQLTNTGRHAAVNGQVSVQGQSGFALGPLSVPPLRSGEETKRVFPEREETAPMWNEGVLSEYTILIEYQDPVGNQYRVENTYRNTITQVRISRSRDGKWEALSSPESVAN